MSLKKVLALAGAALLMGTVAATAAPGFATGNVNVRSGPGTGYGVVDRLQRGERVEIEECRGSWCFVSKRGPDGWVSINYLSRGGGWDDDYRPRPPRPPRPDWDRPPPPPPHWGGPGRPGHGGWDRPGRPGWDRPGRPDWGGRPPRGDDGSQVCFSGPNGYVCVGD